LSRQSAAVNIFEDQSGCNRWGERPREPNNQLNSGSRGRSPHLIDKLP
jgi:hypothetical protein